MNIFDELKKLHPEGYEVWFAHIVAKHKGAKFNLNEAMGSAMVAEQAMATLRRAIETAEKVYSRINADPFVHLSVVNAAALQADAYENDYLEAERQYQRSQEAAGNFRRSMDAAEQNLKSRYAIFRGWGVHSTTGWQDALVQWEHRCGQRTNNHDRNVPPPNCNKCGLFFPPNPNSAFAREATADLLVVTREVIQNSYQTAQAADTCISLKKAPTTNLLNPRGKKLYESLVTMRALNFSPKEVPNSLLVRLALECPTDMGEIQKIMTGATNGLYGEDLFRLAKLVVFECRDFRRKDIL